MKYEWKKQDKDLYLPGTNPVLIDVPSLRFAMIHGEGNPNDEPFSERVGALYAVTWTIKMMPKSGFTPEGYYEYGVFPLEGIWTLAAPWDGQSPLDKAALVYQLMIRQPDFVDDALFAQAQQMAIQKKKDVLHLDEVSFGSVTEGLCVQLTHHGSYDDEPASFARIDAFIAENALTRRGHAHREIYMGDPRKQTADKRRTVLRVPVEKA